MNKNLTLGIGLGTFILAAIGLYFGYGAMVDTIPDPLTNRPKPDPDSVQAALVFTYVAIIIGLAGWIIFSLWGIIQKPKSFIPTAIGLVVFLIIAFIGYSMASSGLEDALSWLDLSKQPGIQAETDPVVWSNAGLITTYIVLIIAIVAILGGMVMGLMRYFKK